MCSSRVVALALALALGACGPLPRPFAHVDADPEALRPADGAGIIVDATRCPNGLGAAVIEALRCADSDRQMIYEDNTRKLLSI